MNRQRYFYAASLAVFLLMSVLPASCQAFAPSSAQAIKVTEHSYLFLITYSLGYQKYDMEVPVFGSTFVATSSNSATQVVRSAAITLSRAPVNDGTYQIKHGTSEEFTFVAAVSFDQNTPAPTDLELSMLNAPFTLVAADGATWPNGLSQGELTRFVARTPQN